MKKEKITKKLQSNNHGITLIALIITIIVLLILAGVTIALITSSESAPKKAVEAKQKQDIGAEKEDLQMKAIGLLAKTESLSVKDETELTNEFTGKVASITKHNNHWDIVGNTGTEYILTSDGRILTQEDLDRLIEVKFTIIGKSDNQQRIRFKCINNFETISNDSINVSEWGVLQYRTDNKYDDGLTLEQLEVDNNIGISIFDTSYDFGYIRGKDIGNGFVSRLYAKYQYDGHTFIKYGEQVHVYYDDLPEFTE